MRGGEKSIEDLAPPCKLQSCALKQLIINYLTNWLLNRIPKTPPPLTCDGLDYAYRSVGTSGGLPLVCLQHFTGTLDNWDPLVIDGLAQYRQVIAISNPQLFRKIILIGTAPQGTLALHDFPQLVGRAFALTPAEGYLYLFATPSEHSRDKIKAAQARFMQRKKDRDKARPLHIRTFTTRILDVDFTL